MSRPSRMALLLAVGLGIPASVEAGGTPSAFDPVFSPVSYRAQYTPYDTGYTPYYAGYTPYYAGYSGSYYIPYSTSYAPGIGCGCRTCSCVGGACGAYGCSSCAGYGCSSCGSYCCSPCGGCASGNCATGACATTTNLAPSGAIAPTPDPAYQSRSIENRLEAVEKALGIDPNARKNTDDNFSRPRRNSGAGTEPAPTTFESPETRSSEPFQRGRSDESNENRANKPALGPPPRDGNTQEVIPTKKPAPGGPIDEKSTLRMDTRVTSRAVSPRERKAFIATSSALPAVAASSKSPIRKVELDAGTRTIDVARQ